MNDKKYNALLWTNDKKNKPNAPDYKGEIEIEGKKLQAAAWIKIARNNKKYISLNIDNNNNKDNKNNKKNFEQNREDKIKILEQLSKKNIKTSKEISQITSGHKRDLKFKSSIRPKKNEKMSTSINQKNFVSLGNNVGGGGTKKTPPKYARYIDEPLGSRSDFIKDRKRSGK